MTTTTSPARMSSNDIPQLRRGVKLIVGMDDQPMLFDSVSGAYHRLGGAAAFIVDQFDGARSLPTIIDQLPQEIDAAGRQRIARLVEYLRSKSLLEGGAPPKVVVQAGTGPQARRRPTRRTAARRKHEQIHPPRWNATGCCPDHADPQLPPGGRARGRPRLHHLPARTLGCCCSRRCRRLRGGGWTALIHLAGGRSRPRACTSSPSPSSW